MHDGVLIDHTLRLFVVSLWTATMYILCITSLIIGGTSPCAKILPTLAWVLCFTKDDSDFYFVLLYGATSLMKMSNESSLLLGDFASFILDTMSMI